MSLLEVKHRKQRIKDFPREIQGRYSSPDYDIETLKLCAECKQILPRSEFLKKASSPDGLGYRCRSCRSVSKIGGNKQKLNLKEGQKFGRLTTVKLDGRDKYGHTIWLCKCECGGSKKVTATALLNKRVSSCGCLVQREGGRDWNSNFLKAHEIYKSGAKVRGYEWGLTKEEVMELFEGNCFYCGSPPSRVKETKNDAPFALNGIDRTDPKVGYILANCVSCCSNCNYIKGTMTLEEFERYIVMVYNNLMKRAGE